MTWQEIKLSSIVFRKCKPLSFLHQQKDKHKEGELILKKTMTQQKQTWLCFLLSPCLVPHVGLLRDSHTPHRDGVIQESVAAGERWVCMWERVSGLLFLFSTHNQQLVKQRGNHKRHEILISFLLVVLFFLSTPSQDCVSECVRKQAACPVTEWLQVSVSVCGCVRVCVPYRAVTVCHAGRRVGRQRRVHFIIAVMTRTSSEEEWLPRPHRHTYNNTPPLTAASQFTLTNTSWSVERQTISLTGTERTSTREGVEE